MSTANALRFAAGFWVLSCAAVGLGLVVAGVHCNSAALAIKGAELLIGWSTAGFVAFGFIAK